MLKEDMFDLCGGNFTSLKGDRLRTEHYTISFNNGYALSIVAGPYLYSGNGTYEVAVIKKNEDDIYQVNYEPEFVNGDVLGYQSVKDIQKYIALLSVFGLLES